MNNLIKVTVLVMVVIVSSCYKVKVPDNLTFKNKLSDYGIYSGKSEDLTPTVNFHLYEVSAELYSNYAEKQRLFKIPEGSQIKNNNYELPDFPEGTILVKTFYYYNETNDTSKGKQIVESRLLIKKDNIWNAAAYIWNKAQTDATLSKEGEIKNVTWKDKSNTERTIPYDIPNQENCAICHQVKEEVMPIGPNLRYLNFDVEREGSMVNQIEHLQSLGLLNNFDHSAVSLIPNYNDATLTDEQRARSYLDANCGYCHKDGGYKPGADRVYNFAYDTELTKSRIDDYNKLIIKDIEEGKMPQIGNVAIDKEGLAIVRKYLETL